MGGWLAGSKASVMAAAARPLNNTLGYPVLKTAWYPTDIPVA